MIILMITSFQFRHISNNTLLSFCYFECLLTSQYTSNNLFTFNNTYNICFINVKIMFYNLNISVVNILRCKPLVKNVINMKYSV